MSQVSQLATSGLSAVAAAAINGTVATSLTALGTTQATGLSLAATNNFIGTAAASTGVVLSFGNPGDTVFVYNGGANAVLVYPPLGGNINNLSANTGLSIPTLKSVLFVYADADTVASLISA